MSGASSELAKKQTILVSRDTENAYVLAAQLFVRLAEEAIAARDVFTVALSGGSTPKKLYELLASQEWRSKIPWNKVEFFWGDERYVPPTDEASNFNMTQKAMLSKVPVPAERIHRVMTETASAEAAADIYEDDIYRVVAGGSHSMPEFDLIWLGLGTNGHMASLFPHQAALHEASRLVVAEYIEEVKMVRVTMTVPLINAAKNVVFVTLGADKASVLKKVITGKYDPETLPAQLVHPNPGKLTWILDPAASAKLPSELLTKA